MRPTPSPRPALLVALLAGWLLLAASPAFAQQHYWYDGAVRRPLWSDAALVADFSVPVAEKSRVLRPAALSKGPDASTSPVFRDSRDSQARPRALPGGVIVTTATDMTEDARRSLFARHGLQTVRELGAGTGRWLVAGPVGIGSLELANRLYESGDFAGASPNWWQPRTRK